MNHTKSSLTITIVLTLAALTYAAGAQEDPRFLGHHEHQGPPVDIAKTMADSAAGLTLPFWQRTVNAFNDPNQPYTITIIGRDPKLPNPPLNGGTLVPTELIPVETYFINWDLSIAWFSDPTALVTEDCADGQVRGRSPIKLAAASPLFNDAPMTWSKLEMGTTQFVDAQMRAEFWGWMPAVDSWHTKLKVHTHDPVVLYVPYGFWRLDNSACGSLGKVDEKYLDAYLRLQTLDVGPTEISLFLTKNLIEYASKEDDYLGYHDAWQPPFSSTIVYGIAPFYIRSSDVWPDIKTLTHEVGEIMNNPVPSGGVKNNTPPWRQGPGEGCQGNFEVGDPRNPVRLGLHSIDLNGFTYHPQELALFGWFYRIDNVARNGQFSTNGTFVDNAGNDCN